MTMKLRKWSLILVAGTILALPVALHADGVVYFSTVIHDLGEGVPSVTTDDPSGSVACAWGGGSQTEYCDVNFGGAAIGYAYFSGINYFFGYPGFPPPGFVPNGLIADPSGVTVSDSLLVSGDNYPGFGEAHVRFDSEIDGLPNHLPSFCPQEGCQSIENGGQKLYAAVVFSGGPTTYADLIYYESDVTDTAPAPEPASLLLVGTGLVRIAILRRSRGKSK